jgi:hypothetical protein
VNPFLDWAQGFDVQSQRFRTRAHRLAGNRLLNVAIQCPRIWLRASKRKGFIREGKP